MFDCPIQCCVCAVQLHLAENADSTETEMVVRTAFVLLLADELSQQMLFGCR